MTVQGLTFNAKWKQLMHSREIYLESRPILQKDTKVFCIGSCFALEIKRALSEMGYRVHPADSELRVPLSNGKEFVTDGRQLTHYNTYCILQEFEKAFGLWRQADDDYWIVRNDEDRFDTNGHYQDPYRRKVVMKEHGDIVAVTQGFDRVMREGILESDVYIITLGLTEVWRKKNNGRIACLNPGYLDNEIEFVRSSFEENYANMKRVIALIGERFPERQIVISVSPVPLSMTFSDEDVMVANTESKAVLRAVATRLAREHKNVYYFPSYEMCAAFEKFGTRKVYREDGRHVLPDTVETIIATFLRHCSTEPAKAPAPTAPAKKPNPFFSLSQIFTGPQRRVPSQKPKKESDLLYTGDEWLNATYEKAMKLAGTDGNRRLLQRAYNLTQLLEQTALVPGGVADLSRGKDRGLLAFIILSYLEKTGADTKGSSYSFFAEYTEDASRTLSAFPGVSYFTGVTPSVFSSVPEKTYRFARIEAKKPEEARSSLEFFYPRLAKGGIIVFDEYGAVIRADMREAVDEFCKRQAFKPLALSTGQAVIWKR